jgi:GT2 family glycosyltransferase
VRVAVVIPNWNGERWLRGVLASVAAQERAPDLVTVVDDGSTDDSRTLVAHEFPGVRLLALRENRGFATAANAGLRDAAAMGAAAVALVNTDVELDRGWLARAVEALEAHPEAASVATKMVDLADPRIVYDAGDVLRRDGVCEQRGRFRPDDGRFDEPGEVFAACAGAALYRLEPVLALDGFDERFGMYLEDVDLGLRLALQGWTCRWEPRALARHAGEGSAGGAGAPPAARVARNTLLLAARAFPVRWLPLVLYRQAGWAWHASRERRLGAHLRGVAAAVPVLPGMLRERRALRRAARVPVEAVVPARPVTRRAGADL